MTTFFTLCIHRRQPQTIDISSEKSIANLTNPIIRKIFESAVIINTFEMV